jgi:putative ABC transport system ATP-binding protein
VSWRYTDGPDEIALLNEVCFTLRKGEIAGLYGASRSGKSMLLRLACGIECPQQGEVSFDGRDLARLSRRKRTKLLRDEVALVAAETWPPNPKESALDCVAIALGSRGVALRDARRLALVELDRLGVAACSHDPVIALPTFQRSRVALARALVHRPRMLLVDEPAPLPSISQRERFCALLRELARERGFALLIASEDITALQGVQLLMSISGGRLSFADEGAKVVRLQSRRVASGERP